MHQDIETAVYEEAKKRDDIFYQISDVHDVKSGLILAVVALLATISAQILALHDLSLFIKSVQVVVVFSLTVAVIACIFALWPRVFEVPPETERWLSFLEQSREEHKDAGSEIDALVLRDYLDSRSRVTLKRTAQNRAKVYTKAQFNNLAFYALALAIVAELFSLDWLVVWRF